jgi:hypothetical protein
MLNGKDQRLADDLLARHIDIFRFEAGERQKVLRILKTMEEDLIDILLRAKLTEIGRADKAALLKQAQAVISDYYGRAGSEVDQSLGELGRLEAAVSVADMGAAFSGAIEMQLPPESYFKALVSETLIQGAPSRDWWGKQAADVQFRFANELRQGLAQGETNAQIIRRIKGGAGVPGLMDKPRHNVAALVQTSVATVANSARLAGFKANADLMKGFHQLSTLDGHTSTTCVAYSGGEWGLQYKPINGTKLPFNGGPPRHFNCRSILTPLLKTFRELGIDIPEPPRSTRASSDGPIAASTTFEQFLDRKGATFTDNLLGPGRAELWRERKITLQQLLDQSGRPLSLDALKAKYA